MFDHPHSFSFFAPISLDACHTPWLWPEVRIRFYCSCYGCSWYSYCCCSRSSYKFVQLYCNYFKNWSCQRLSRFFGRTAPASRPSRNRIVAAAPPWLAPLVSRFSPVLAASPTSRLPSLYQIYVALLPRLAFQFSLFSVILFVVFVVFPVFCLLFCCSSLPSRWLFSNWSTI